MLARNGESRTVSSALVAAKPNTNISRRGDKDRHGLLLSEPGTPNAELRAVNAERRFPRGGTEASRFRATLLVALTQKKLSLFSPSASCTSTAADCVSLNK